MRRIATWLLVGAVAALGVAAAVDVMRGGEQVTRRPASMAAVLRLADQPELAIRQLREAGVRGVLTYADEKCRLHAVSLPDLEPVRAPSYEMCRPATATGGLGAVGGDVVWAGLGYGAMQVVLSRGDLTRAFVSELSPRPGEGAAFRAVQAASLGDGRYVVLADSEYRPRERFVAAFDGARARFVHPQWSVEAAPAIRPSSSGRYYAVLGRDARGVRLFTRDGREVELPSGVTRPETVAWSPDDHWTALATAESIYVYPSDRAEELVVRIPLAVHDLAWSE